MRGIAYRRAQQERMIERAKRSRVVRGLVEGRSQLPAGFVRSWANNLAKCSCWMCNNRHSQERSHHQMKQDVATRQQLEGVTTCV